MNKTLEQILESSRTYTSEGRVADYIPELAKANREEIGIFVALWENLNFIKTVKSQVGKETIDRKSVV